MWRRLLTLVVLVCLTGTARAGRADPEDVARTLAGLVKDLRYEEAIGRGLGALRTLKVPHEQARRLGGLYLQLATAYYLLGQEGRAARMLVSLFAADPGARTPPDASPKLRGFIEAIRLDFFRAALDHTPPGRATAGEPLDLEVRLGNVGSRVAAVVVFVRPRGAAAFDSVRLPRSGVRFRGRIPVPAAAPDGALEYYVEARTATDVPIAGIGTDAAPLAVPVRPPVSLTVVPPPPPVVPPPPPPPPPLYRRPWVWAGAAVAVLAVAGGVYLLSSSPEPSANGNGMMMPPAPVAGLDICIAFEDRPCP